MTKKKDPKDLKKRGRKSKVTKECVAKLEAAFKVGATDIEACQYADIDRSTLFRYEQSNPEFRNKKEEWKSRPTLKAKFSVYKGLDDPKLALDYLKSKDKEFSTKVEQNVSGGLNLTPVTFNILPVKSKDEL